jgi:hypothetical protein
MHFRPVACKQLADMVCCAIPASSVGAHDGTSERMDGEPFVERCIYQ